MNETEPTVGSAVFEPLVAGEGFTSSPAGPERTYGHAAELEDSRDFFLSSIEAEKKKAYARGLADGERETLASMSEKLDAQMEQWRATMAALDTGVASALDSFFEKVEARVVMVAIEVARRIVGAEVRVRPEAIAERVRGALSRYRAEPVITVHVNPADHVFLDRLSDNPERGAGPVVHYESTPDVPRGGFIVETALARYDHTMESELREMEQVLADLYEPLENQ